MDLGFTEEQQMLRKAARDFLAKEFPKTLVRQMEDDPAGVQPGLWRKMAELGWTGLAVPGEYGGVGGSFMDVFVLLEEMGRACLIAPFLSTILGTYAIVIAGSEEQKQTLLPGIADGERIIVPAFTEPSASYEAEGIQTTAKDRGSDYVVDGTKLFVHDAHVADYLLCAARTDPAAPPREGISVLMVDAKSPGIGVTPLPTMADDRQHEVRFEGVAVPKQNLLGEWNGGWLVVSKMLELAAIAKCAEMIGGADWTIETCIAYARDRVQYGRPIGSFQALQHILAEMWTDVHHAKQVTYYAASLVDQGRPCMKEVAMAKAMMGDVYVRVTRMGVQAHGGIGTTREHDMGLYYRRARQAATLFGSPEFWRERVAQEIGM